MANSIFSKRYILFIYHSEDPYCRPAHLDPFSGAACLAKIAIGSMLSRSTSGVGCLDGGERLGLLKSSNEDAVLLLPLIENCLRSKCEELQNSLLDVVARGPRDGCSVSSSSTATSHGGSLTHGGSLCYGGSLMCDGLPISLCSSMAGASLRIALDSMNALHLLCTLVGYCRHVRLAIVVGGGHSIDGGNVVKPIELHAGNTNASDAFPV